MKLGCWRKHHKGQEALRIYANGAFSMIVKTDGSFAALITSSQAPHCSGDGDQMHLPVSQSQEMFNFLQTAELNIHLTCSLSITLTALLLGAGLVKLFSTISISFIVSFPHFNIKYAGFQRFSESEGDFNWMC